MFLSWEVGPAGLSFMDGVALGELILTGGGAWFLA
jgi:hypothetical protein